MPPALTAEEIRDVNTRYHDVAAGHYDAKWGIDFGDIGLEQVGAKVRKALGGQPGPLRGARWRSARGPGYFTLNMMRAGADRAGDLHRHLAGDARNAERQRAASGPGGRDRAAPTPSGCRSRTRASTSCWATRCCITSPTSPPPSASSRACWRRAARCCSPASPRATATAWRGAQALRGRGGAAVAPRAARPTGAAGRRAARRTRRWRAWSTCTPSRPANCASSRAGRDCEQVRVGGEELHRELVRLDQPHAGGDRRAGGRAVGVAPVRLPRLPALPAARPPAAGAAAAGGDLLQPDALGAQGGLTQRARLLSGTKRTLSARDT